MSYMDGVLAHRNGTEIRTTRKMVPITGRASSFLVFLEFQDQNSEVGGQNNNNSLSIYPRL